MHFIHASVHFFGISINPISKRAKKRSFIYIRTVNMLGLLNRSSLIRDLIGINYDF